MAKQLSKIGEDKKFVKDISKRSEDVSLKGERIENFNISLLTIDTAIISHLNENLRPNVIQNNHHSFYNEGVQAIKIRKNGDYNG